MTDDPCPGPNGNLLFADRAGDGGHTDWAELYPDRLGFAEPWDGTYDT